MVDFSRMQGPLRAAFFDRKAELFEPAHTVSAHGDRLPGEPESLGVIACDLQDYSDALAQQEYGLTETVHRRMYCAANERVRPGRLVRADGAWYRIAALPETGAVFAALLERREVS